jgi:hypothetical protein
MNTNDPFDPYTPAQPELQAPWDDPWLLQDADGDGLTNQQELWLGTDPYRVDTDGDGLTDGQELAFGSNPRFPDSDWDGIQDGADWWNGPQADQTAPPPPVQETTGYERFSQGIDNNLPPFAQARQVAQAALAEDLPIAVVQDLLSESPKFKEIQSTLGLDYAEQFASLAIAAAERQNAIESVPQPSQTMASQPDLQNCKQPRLL